MVALFPRESAKLISELSKHASISENGIKHAADILQKALSEKSFSIKNWKEHDVHPKSMDADAVNWVFLVDTLNFSFWSANTDSPLTISYNNKSYTGYFAFCAAVNRALQDGIPITNPEFYANITLDQLSAILRSDGGDEMPLLEKRVAVLRETGKILIEKFHGTFVTALSQCDKSAKKLLKIVIENFPSYKDEADYCGHKVSFYKRAQILIGDIWSSCEGQGLGTFHDIDSITVFADYRIPQLLLHLGVLRYSDELMKLLSEGKELENGSCEEVEIRGCTIWACEMICEELRKRSESDLLLKATTINPILVDYFLWDYRREHRKETDSTPFHRTRCIYY